MHSYRKSLKSALLSTLRGNASILVLRLALGSILLWPGSSPCHAQSDSNPLAEAKAAAEQARQARAAAEQAAAEAKARAEQAAADRAAAEKDLHEKTAAAIKAEQTVNAQETYAADKALAESTSALTKVETAASEAETAARNSAADLQRAKAVRDQAQADKAAAEQALAQAAEADKQAAEAALSERSQALQTAEEQLQAAQTAADKSAADLGGRQEERTRARQAVLDARERAAVAKASAMGGLKPLAASQWSYEKARHLLLRAGLGGPPDEVKQLHEMGLFAAVDHLVDYHLQPEPAGWFDAFPHLRTAPYEHLLNASQRAELDQSRVTFRWDQHHRLRRAWLERMARTERPLQEKLALFWHGHFACSYLAGEDSYSMWQQNEMFRRRASGNFGALLRGIAHDPAMIVYLDNHVNFKGSGNENLGREILELFSMGEGQGYTEQDLAEAARALTGFNLEYHDGQFRFIADRHDTEEKSLFGKTGRFGGDELVDLILQQPATARYIVLKLFRFFAHENPEPDTIEKMATVLRGYNYELRPMLRNFFGSEEFYSELSMGNHIKSPVELVIGAIRTLRLESVDFKAIDTTVSDMGQRLFEPPNVAGWEGGRAWIDANTLLLRYNALAQLVEQADLVAWLKQAAAADPQPASAVDHLARAFLCVPLSEPKRQELITYLGELPPPDQWDGRRDEIHARLRAVAVALVSLPEYQLAGDVSDLESPAVRLAAAGPR